MTLVEQPFTVILEDDQSTVAEGKLPGADAGPTWAKHRVSIELDEGDTAGHALDTSSVSITLRFDDDVEGHALSLHFPTADKADAFRKRLLATGVVAGALVVGVTAAQFSGAIPTTSVGPLAAPAPIVAQPQVNPRLPAEDLVAPATGPIVAQPQVNPRLPAEELAPATAPIVAQPQVNPRIPAEDLAPATAPIVAQPQVNPRIPAEDLTASGPEATAPKLSSAHISGAAAATVSDAAKPLPGNHHTR